MRARPGVDQPRILPAGEPRTGGQRKAMRELAAAFQELSSLTETDAVLRCAVEFARESIGLERVGIFLADPQKRLMIGTWGTDLECRTRDEHHIMFGWTEDALEVFRRAAEDGVPWTMVENFPTIEHLGGEPHVCDRSWVVYTPIFSARRPIGMMFNDAARNRTPVDEERQDLLAVLCAFIGSLLDRRGLPDELVAPFRRKNGLVSTVVQELANEPSLSGVTLARRHGVSVSRLARAFKAEMGMSIVEHRNRLRLQRFFRLVEAGHGLSAAALEAGFGSYAQFHRVFRALHKSSPAAYLGRSESRKAHSAR